MDTRASARMKRPLKIALSIVFVVVIAFVVARVFWPKPGHKPPAAKVVVKKKPAAKPAAAQPSQQHPHMAIILDDWGASGVHVDEALAVGRPLTLAIIPHLRSSQQVAEEAHTHGLGVMLHMPMQPKNRRASEPHAIQTTMADGDIRQLLDSALASIPYVEGVNNHQGSAATSDLRVMTTVLSHLKSKGLFFIDSKVIAASVGLEAAKKTGIRFASRDVFIDNVATVAAVKEQIQKAITVARTHGEAVVIGHDKSPTLEALREMVPEIEKNGIKLVLVKDIVTVRA